MRVILTAVVFLCCGSAWSAPADCIGISNDAAHLACYDREVGRKQKTDDKGLEQPSSPSKAPPIRDRG